MEGSIICDRARMVLTSLLSLPLFRAPRGKAAGEGIERHYTVADNPGQGDAGLYYYYHAFAAALAAAKLDAVEAADGQSHDWRRGLVAGLAERQRGGGRPRPAARPACDTAVGT